MSLIKASSDEIVNRINKAYKLRHGIFDDVQNLLEHQIPVDVQYSSIEHARFYFYLIFNDHGTKSINLYQRFKKLYKESPSVFLPQYVATQYGGKDIEFRDKYLTELGLRYPSQAAKSWIINSQKMVTLYSGEPINLFKDSTNALELYKKVLKFRSYGPKTSGLLLRVIIGVGFNRQLHGISSVPLPVDIHDSRIAFMCNLYRPDGIDDINQIYNSPYHIKQIESIWRVSAKNIGVDWEEIDRALWLLGSIGCINKRCRECPIMHNCETGKEFI